MHDGLDQHLKFLVNTFYNQDQTRSVDECWEKILSNFFPHSLIEKQTSSIDTSQLSNDNSYMLVPIINSNAHFKLALTDRSHTFTPHDLDLADSLLHLTEQFVSTREAIERGAHEERQRIARDLHDDVAARLLTLIHQVKDEKSIELTRSILKSLRNAIYTLDNKSTTTILDAITDIRAEIQDRLNSLGIQLFWQQAEHLERYIFTPRQHINLQRISHEIVTNIIRHANANYVHFDIELENELIHISAIDDGDGFDINGCVPGKGINNIKNRVAELSGSVSWSNYTDPETGISGCAINIRFPLTTQTE
ncbi:MAG: histidine kinase [Gammaproteobacteria bacterium]|nr:histidine kinase [Gammaproteobacteria bacterium]MDH5735080.1 histidine kinase [Gammaproteobacteria bacterium]